MNGIDRMVCRKEARTSATFVIRSSSFGVRHSFVLGYFVLRHSLTVAVAGASATRACAGSPEPIETPSQPSRTTNCVTRRS
jgi:hypothetical protein